MEFKKIEFMTEAGIPVESMFSKCIQENVLYDVFPELKDFTDKDGLVQWKELLKDFDALGKPGLTNLGYLKSKKSDYVVMLHPY